LLNSKKVTTSNNINKDYFMIKYNYTIYNHIYYHIFNEILLLNLFNHEY